MGISVQRCTALKLVEHNYSSVAQLPEVSGSRRSRRSAGKYAAFRGKYHGAGTGTGTGAGPATVAVGAKSAIKYLYCLLKYIACIYACHHKLYIHTYIYM